MKKTLRYLIILAVAVAALLVFLAACDEPAFEGANDEYYFTGKGGSLTITAYRKETADAVTIPSEITYNGATYKVTGIGENCFKENEKLLKVTIPASVESVGASAFEGCKNLMDVVFTGEAKNFVLGERAFANLPKLKSLHLSKNTASIPKECFKDSFTTGTEKFTTLTIGETVTEIGDSAFENANIQAINLPASLKTIGVRAFALTDALRVQMLYNSETGEYHEAENVNASSSATLKDRCSEFIFAEGLETIGRQGFYDAFYSNSYIKIYLPALLSKIDGGAFAGCNSGSVIINEENPYYVCASNFLMTADRKTLVCFVSTSTPTFSQSSTSQVKEITEIMEYAFGKSTSSSTVTLPAHIKAIGEFAFYEYSAATFKIEAEHCVFVANSFGQNAKFLLPANSFTYNLAKEYKNMSVGDYANNWTLETN